MHSTRRTLLTALGLGAVAASGGCLSLLDDRRAWRYSTDGNWIPYPVVDAGRVYVGATAGPFRALDAADGALRWTFDTDAPASTRPAVAPDTVYVGDVEGGLYAIPITGGEPRWTTRLPKIALLPVLEEGTLFVGGDDAHGVYPVSLADGRIDDRFAGATDTASDPVVHDDSIYVGDNAGGVTAFDRASGAVRWQRVFENRIRFGMAFADGTLYVTSGDTLYALDANDGTTRWRFRADETVYVARDVVQGAVYVGGVDRHLYALDAGDGTERWRFEARDALGHSTVVDDTVYVGDYSGRFYAIDAVDGTERWHTEVGGQISTRPAVDDGHVYVGDETGLLALER